MIWTKPIGTWLPPLLFLILAVLTLGFDFWGIESALSARLLAAWHHAGAMPAEASFTATLERLSQVMPGPLLRPFGARLLEILWLALLGAGAIALLRFGLAWSSALVLAAIAGGTYLSWCLFALKAVFLDAASPDLGLALLLAVSTLAYMRQVAAARTALRMAFAESLPRATIEKIARKPSLLKIDGEIRCVTYLVCGVRGLPGVAASFRDDPAAFTSAMQNVLTPLMDQALAHGGTIDRLTADGFAAFWNAPLNDPDHAVHACEAANGMSIMAARATEDMARLQGLQIGVGVATGPAIAGGFGGHGRMGYSVHGEAVQMAGHIQNLSQQYGPAVIVSEETRKQAERGFAFLEVDAIAAGDQGAPIRLYAMLGNPVVRASPKFRALTTFHDHIFQALRKQQWGKARELIAQCRRLSGASQNLYDLHLTRIAYFERNPPGENWDGAFRPILK